MAIISRRQYDHPALATAGGSALHASISNLYTVLGDDSMSRYKAFTAVANSSVGVIAHEFGLDFANLKVQIFTGTYPALTLVSDPIGTGWTVAATSGLASRSIDITAPASGGPHTYAVLVSHESNATAFIPGLVSIGAQSFAGPKTFLSPILSSLGTAALPGYSFTGDPNTGMWSSAADTLSFSTAGVKVAEASSTGAWTLGPASAGSLLHTVNGIATFQSSQTGATATWKFNNTGAAAASTRLEMSALGTTVSSAVYQRFLRGAAGTTTEWDVGIIGYVNGSYEWSALGGSPAGSITQAGAWTLGVTASQATVSTRPNHNIYSRTINLRNPITSVGGGGSAVTDLIFLDFYNRADAPKWSFGVHESQFSGTETNPSMMWFSYNTAAYVGGISAAGDWTLGPSNTSAHSALVHQVYGSTFRIDNNGTDADATLGISNDAQDWVLRVKGDDSDRLIFRNGTTATNVGNITTAGAWTLGPASSVNQNLIVNGTMAVNHNSTDGAPAISSFGTTTTSLTRVYLGGSAAASSMQLIAVGGSSENSTKYLEISSNATLIAQFYASKQIGINSTNSAASPSYSFYGDLDTGMYSSAGNTLNFATAGTSVGTVSSAGAWTLGTTSMTTNHFINSAESTQVLVVESYAATASNTKRILDARYGADTDCTGGYFFSCLNSSSSVIGRIEASSNTTTSFTGSSDSRLKTNPTDFNGLQIVANIIPREYEWISNPGNRQKGFYAQELYDVYPDAVSVGTDDLTEDGSLALPWGIDYSRLTPVLVKAIQELSAKNDALEARLAALES